MKYWIKYDGQSSYIIKSKEEPYRHIALEGPYSSFKEAKKILIDYGVSHRGSWNEAVKYFRSIKEKDHCRGEK